MIEEVLGTSLTIIVPGLVGFVGYVMKSYLTRIQELEKEIQAKVSEDDVRQLLIDKIEPLREDVQELKYKLDKIVDILLKKK